MKLYDMELHDIEALLQSWDEPKYRAGQLFSWCAKGVAVEQMTNIPNSLKEKLQKLGIGGVQIEKVQQSKDGTEKYLFRCQDGEGIEGVLMRYEHGNTLCISTQAGCRMGCVFCASGENGLSRNLETGEIVGQLYAVIDRYGERPFSNVVLMGCGEPFDNYDNVMKFLRIISHEKGLNMSLRNVSLSTCGLVEEMDIFAKEGLPVTLCISLHAADDETRKHIMPVAKRYAIEDVVAAAKRYDEATGRRVVFEYTLIKDINDSVDDAKRLAKLTAGIRKHINLIPVNDARGKYEPPAPAQANAFLKALKDKGVSVTLRRTLGADIDGACGQLRNVALEGK